MAEINSEASPHASATSPPKHYLQQSVVAFSPAPGNAVGAEIILEIPAGPSAVGKHLVSSTWQAAKKEHAAFFHASKPRISSLTTRPLSPPCISVSLQSPATRVETRSRANVMPLHTAKCAEIPADMNLTAIAPKNTALATQHPEDPPCSASPVAASRILQEWMATRHKLLKLCTTAQQVQAHQGALSAWVHGALSKPLEALASHVELNCNLEQRCIELETTVARLQLDATRHAQEALDADVCSRQVIAREGKRLVVLEGKLQESLASQRQLQLDVGALQTLRQAELTRLEQAQDLLQKTVARLSDFQQKQSQCLDMLPILAANYSQAKMLLEKLRVLVGYYVLCLNENTVQSEMPPFSIARISANIDQQDRAILGAETATCGVLRLQNERTAALLLACQEMLQHECLENARLMAKLEESKVELRANSAATDSAASKSKDQEVELVILQNEVKHMKDLLENEKCNAEARASEIDCLQCAAKLLYLQIADLNSVIESRSTEALQQESAATTAAQLFIALQEKAANLEADVLRLESDKARVQEAALQASQQWSLEISDARSQLGREKKLCGDAQRSSESLCITNEKLCHELGCVKEQLAALQAKFEHHEARAADEKRQHAAALDAAKSAGDAVVQQRIPSHTGPLPTFPTFTMSGTSKRKGGAGPAAVNETTAGCDAKRMPSAVSIKMTRKRVAVSPLTVDHRATKFQRIGPVVPSSLSPPPPPPPPRASASAKPMAPPRAQKKATSGWAPTKTANLSPMSPELMASTPTRASPAWDADDVRTRHGHSLAAATVSPVLLLPPVQPSPSQSARDTKTRTTNPRLPAVKSAVACHVQDQPCLQRESVRKIDPSSRNGDSYDLQLMHEAAAPDFNFTAFFQKTAGDKQ